MGEMRSLSAGMKVIFKYLEKDENGEEVRGQTVRSFVCYPEGDGESQDPVLGVMDKNKPSL